MSEVIAPSVFLSAEEIDALCAPLTQRRAQTRRLCALLGVDTLPTRPDGLPLVGRKLLEERLNGRGDSESAAGFNWSR